MKRCMSLIHLVLEYAEKEATGGLLAPPRLPGHSEEQVEYHVLLCEQAGFLTTSEGYILHLTWRGHEELKSWRQGASHNCS